jgi:hypothetical protein
MDLYGSKSAVIRLSLQEFPFVRKKTLVIILVPEFFGLFGFW